MSTSGSGKSGNVYDASSAAYGQAGNALSGAAGALNNNWMQQGGAATYNPSLMQAATGRASTAANPNTIYQGIGNYMNPYTDDVITRTAADIQNQTNQQLDQIGATAAKSGAFGGSRHGLVEATAMSEAQKNIGDVSANLRNQGFNTALQYSGQDVANQMQNNQFNAGQNQGMTLANLGYLNQARANNQNANNAAGQFNASANNAWNQNAYAQNTANAGALGNLGALGQSLAGDLFDAGQSISSTQSQQGALQQQLIQSIMDNAGGQFEGFTNWPTSILNMAVSALGMNPMQQATTTTGTTTPGWMDYLSLGSQMFGYSRLGA